MSDIVDTDISETLDEFATLAGLLVDLGGRIEELVEVPFDTVRLEVDREATARTGEAVFIPKLTESFTDLVATLRVKTADLEKHSVKHGNRHDGAPTSNV